MASMLEEGGEMGEERKRWLLQALLDKLVARGCKPTLRMCLKRAFVKFDRNGSGELDMEEFRLAMEEHLPGIDENEFLALARTFDENGDGVVSVSEFVGALERLRGTEETGATAPGGFSNGEHKAPLKRRPYASGTEPRRTSEFVDDGYNRKPKYEDEPDEQWTRFFVGLKERAVLKARSLTGAGDDLDDTAVRLLQRALERRKSSPKVRHLTAKQFREGLAFFDDQSGTFLNTIDLAVLYKKCHNGDYAFLVDLFRREILKQQQLSVVPNHGPKLSKRERRTLELKHLLLDKINSKDAGGAPFRVKLKRVVAKYDLDHSGELEKHEFERAFAELLPGVPSADIDALLADVDQDRNGAVSVDEVANSLLNLQVHRHPPANSLKLKRKAPLHTKLGARGLA